MGTSGEGKIGQDLLPNGFRLVNVRSEATSIGSLTVHRSPVIRNGRRRNEPNGLLSFKAKENAAGSGVVEYTIEDAIGQRSNGLITISISGEIEVYLD